MKTVIILFFVILVLFTGSLGTYSKLLAMAKCMTSQRWSLVTVFDNPRTRVRLKEHFI